MPVSLSCAFSARFGSELLLFEALLFLPGLEARRQLEAEFAGQLARQDPQLAPIVGELDRPHFLDIDPRPDDMAMLAPVLDMKDDGARLICKAEAVLDGAMAS